MKLPRRSLLALVAASALAALVVTTAFAATPARPAAHSVIICPLRPVLAGGATGLSSQRSICPCGGGPIRAGSVIHCGCPGPVFAGPCPGSVSVTGAVGTPASYSRAELAAMPQTKFTIGSHGRGGSKSATGVSLESLVQTAQPTVSPTVKNGLLRVTVTVAGSTRTPVTFAEGELDPSFGDHPAYLALTVGGRTLSSPKLLVPGDDRPIRDVAAVSTITVAVQNPTPTAGFTPGTLTVERGSHATTLTAARLAALRSERLHASFLAGTTQTDVTEAGPSLDEVLRAAHVRLGLNTWVAGVGDDGYVAVVTPAEQRVAGKQLQISLNENGAPLTEPRLVVDGDVKGGRYVSGLVDLVVGHGAAPRLIEPIPQLR